MPTAIHPPARSIGAATLALALAHGLSLPAFGQTVDTDTTLLIQTGHVFSTGDVLTSVRLPRISSTGRWVALGTLNGSTACVVVDGEIGLRVGSGAAGGATVHSIEDVAIANDGTVAALYDIENSTNPNNPLARIQVGTDVIY